MKQLQDRVRDWVLTTFGNENPLLYERALRMLEEAVETTQCCKVPRDQVHRLIDYVYDRPVGDISQEIGGTAVGLLALAAFSGVNSEEALLTELDRIESPEIRAKARRRDLEKQAAGVGVHKD